MKFFKSSMKFISNKYKPFILCQDNAGSYYLYTRNFKHPSLLGIPHYDGDTITSEHIEETAEIIADLCDIDIAFTSLHSVEQLFCVVSADVKELERFAMLFLHALENGDVMNTMLLVRFERHTSKYKRMCKYQYNHRDTKFGMFV